MNAHAPARTYAAYRTLKAVCSDGRTRSVRFVRRASSVWVQVTVDGCAVTGHVDESCDPPRFHGSGRNSDLVGD